MKKAILITILLAMSSLTMAQEKSKVYFIRVSYWSGLMGNFKAFIDDALVCNLNNHKYSIHEVEPGKHKFTVQFSGKTSKEGTNDEALYLTTEPGKSYYVALMFESGTIKNNLFCEELTEPSGKHLMERCVRDTKCD